MAKAKFDKDKETEPAEIAEPFQPQCAAGDDADTTHLREAKRAYSRTVERQAKRQYEQRG